MNDNGAVIFEGPSRIDRPPGAGNGGAWRASHLLLTRDHRRGRFLQEDAHG